MAILNKSTTWRMTTCGLFILAVTVPALGDQPGNRSARPAADPSKRREEAPLKRVVETTTAPGPGDFVNPRVAPGLVNWHKDFEAACAAAKHSGKPVLLFLLMGKLDDQFC
jgi:hypothetical protein